MNIEFVLKFLSDMASRWSEVTFLVYQTEIEEQRSHFEPSNCYIVTCPAGFTCVKVPIIQKNSRLSGSSGNHCCCTALSLKITSGVIVWPVADIHSKFVVQVRESGGLLNGIQLIWAYKNQDYFYSKPFHYPDLVYVVTIALLDDLYARLFQKFGFFFFSWIRSVEAPLYLS